MRKGNLLYKLILRCISLVLLTVSLGEDHLGSQYTAAKVWIGRRWNTKPGICLLKQHQQFCYSISISAAIGFESISDRLRTLRLRDKFQNISRITVHVTTEEIAHTARILVTKQWNNHSKPVRYDIKIILNRF